METMGTSFDITIDGCNYHATTSEYGGDRSGCHTGVLRAFRHRRKPPHELLRPYPFYSAVVGESVPDQAELVAMVRAAVAADLDPETGLDETTAAAVIDRLGTRVFADHSHNHYFDSVVWSIVGRAAYKGLADPVTRRQAVEALTGEQAHAILAETDKPPAALDATPCVRHADIPADLRKRVWCDTGPASDATLSCGAIIEASEQEWRHADALMRAHRIVHKLMRDASDAADLREPGLLSDKDVLEMAATAIEEAANQARRDANQLDNLHADSALHDYPGRDRD